MGGACSTHRRHENCMQTLGGKPEGKRSLMRSRPAWKDKWISE